MRSRSSGTITSRSMQDLADMTWEELLRIARMWGYDVDTMIRPNGYVDARLVYGKLKFTIQRYGSERAAINDMLSMMRTHIDMVIEKIDKERTG